MKKLLLSLTLLLGSYASFAQLTCATATAITADGTITVPAISGTYQALCWGSAATAPNAIWYSFTAPSNGEVTINADLPQNVAPSSEDQRVSIATGTCATLTCYGGQDDISDTNYYVNYTFPVAAGTTYYIVWDDRWDANGFDFDFTFDAAVSCIRPGDLSVTAPTNITNNSANLTWGAAIGSPASYDVEVGAVGFVQGTGTLVNTASTSTPVSGVANTNSDFYLRSNCGSTQSAWVGPFSLFLAVNLPYSNNFDGVAPQTNADGFSSATWGLGNAAGGAQSGAVYYFSGSSTTAATNANLFTRPLNLQANEQVTLTFYTRLGSATGTQQSLRVLVNTTPSATGAAQVGSTITVTGTTYALQTVTFTASVAGTYYVIFNNNTPIVATATSLRLDTVSMTSVLGTNDFLSSNFNIFPNPVKNVINFSNDSNAVVSLVEMTDLNGRVIKSQKVNATEGQISVSDLATGMYMMKITTDQGVAVKKIVKQ